VCGACYTHYKNDTVHAREWVERQLNKTPNPKATPETRERNILYQMFQEADEWAILTREGLSNVCIAVDAIDDDDDLPDKAGHKRRIAFMLDLVAYLPDELFAPATRAQLDAALRVAIDYWDGKVADDKRKIAHEQLRAVLDKTDSTKWDIHSLPLWTLQPESFFDWMWYQWFDCVWSCFSSELKKQFESTVMELLQKHFHNEIQNWVNLTIQP
jgi:hypothetical protein